MRRNAQEIHKIKKHPAVRQGVFADIKKLLRLRGSFGILRHRSIRFCGHSFDFSGLMILALSVFQIAVTQNDARKDQTAGNGNQ
jgi:hypothetical protein